MQQEQAGDVIVNCNGIEIFDNDFELAISEACEKYGIDDLVKEGQTRWKAVCHYVGKRVFPDNKILRDKSTMMIEGNPVSTDCNRYDYNILNTLCDYYIQVSRRYNKLISSIAFGEFVNISVYTIDQWGKNYRDSGELSKTGSLIWKKLQMDREDGLKDKALDSGNVMGVFQVGRREYQWDMPGVREDQHARRSLTDAELPKLSENNQTKAIGTDVSRNTQFQTI